MQSIGMQLSSMDQIQYIHPFACRVVSFLVASGYIPIQAQVSVAYPKLRLATAVDQIWQQRISGRFAVIELKKYETRTYEEKNGFLNAPYETHADNHRNRHQLQLFWSWWMFCSQYNLTNVDAFVIRVHTHSIRTYPMEPWVAQLSEEYLKTAR